MTKPAGVLTQISGGTLMIICLLLSFLMFKGGNVGVGLIFACGMAGGFYLMKVGRQPAVE